MQAHPGIEFFGVALGEERWGAVGRRKAGKSVIHLGEMHWCAHETCAGWIGGCLLVLWWLGGSLGRKTGVEGIELLLSIVGFLFAPVVGGGKEVRVRIRVWRGITYDVEEGNVVQSVLRR